MNTLASRRVLMPGILLIVLVNAFVLAGVGYNRSGDPLGVLLLTERELSLPGRYGLASEDSGIRLKLKWSIGSMVKQDNGYGYQYTNPEWLDKTKLEQLGFDVDAVARSYVDNGSHYSRPLPREAYLVLEHDGDAYQAAIQRAEQYLQEEQQQLEEYPHKDEFRRRVKSAQQRLDRLKQSDSRLFVIDAGADFDNLARLYSQPGRYLILAGELRMNVQKEKGGELKFSGHIQQLSNTNIHVPLDQRMVLQPLFEDRKHDPFSFRPQYAVKAAWGKRLEPWIISISAMN